MSQRKKKIVLHTLKFCLLQPETYISCGKMFSILFGCYDYSSKLINPP